MQWDAYLMALDSYGGQRAELAKQERWRAMQRWREIYAAPVHAATGRWKHGQYEWHVFSSGYSRSIHGLKAVESYLRETVTPLCVVPESSKWPAFRCTPARMPDLSRIEDDICVFDENLSWTMCFTHEQSIGLGPYFSRKEWMAIEEGRTSHARR